MKIIFDDFVQNSNAPDFLKSIALADDGIVGDITITFPEVKTYNAIGIGNAVELVNGVEVSKAPQITINGEIITLDIGFDANGLYMLPQEYNLDNVVISLPTQYSVGRIAVGMAQQLGLAPAREPGFSTTTTNRTTRGGQAIAGLGGVDFRVQSVDVRYKFTMEIIRDIQNAYPAQISRGFPLFVSFTENCSNPEIYPFSRLYAKTKDKIRFQSSANKPLYSTKLTFEERY